MPEFIQTNVNLTETDAAMLDRMMTEDGYDNRSAWIRWLIRQEWARRYSRANPGVTIAQAQAAGQTIEKK